MFVMEGTKLPVIVAKAIDCETQQGLSLFFITLGCRRVRGKLFRKFSKVTAAL
jgi:hypothetical protein